MVKLLDKLFKRTSTNAATAPHIERPTLTTASSLPPAEDPSRIIHEKLVPPTVQRKNTITAKNFKVVEVPIPDALASTDVRWLLSDGNMSSGK
jgi:hypothetical protein